MCGAVMVYIDLLVVHEASASCLQIITRGTVPTWVYVDQLRFFVVRRSTDFGFGLLCLRSTEIFCRVFFFFCLFTNCTCMNTNSSPSNSENVWKISLKYRKCLQRRTIVEIKRIELSFCMALEKNEWIILAVRLQWRHLSPNIIMKFKLS